MKVKRILASVFAGVIALGGCLGLVGCGKDKEYELLDKNECHKSVEPTNVYWENYSKSQAEFDSVIINFTQSDGEYTDDFGGSFVDENGIYNICIVGSKKETNSNYLIFEQVENSLNTLNGISNGVIKLMDKYNVWSVGICEKCNKVKICIEKENQIDLIIETLKRENLLKKNTLLFYVGKNLNMPN